MGKTRDLFKKIGEIRGTFPERMGMIKDRNDKTKQKLKRLRISGKKNYTKKVLMTWITTMVWSLTCSQTS